MASSRVEEMRKLLSGRSRLNRVRKDNQNLFHHTKANRNVLCRAEWKGWR